MTPPAPGRPSQMLVPLVYAAFALTVTTLPPVRAVEPETCFSRQHQSAIVNVRQAVSRASTAMDAREVRSERDCVLACCSEEVKPGAKCNMVVFNGNKHAGEDNCFLFHCPTEQDCPLTKAQDGINTYDIYKGLLHPTTVRPATTTPTTTTEQTTTTTATPAPTVPTTARPTTPQTTTPPTTTTTTRPTTTTTTTTLPPTTTSSPVTTTISPPIIIIATMPAVTSSPTTAKTPPPSPISTKKPNKTSRKQNKTSRKGKPHPITTTTTTQPTQSSTTTTSLPVTASKEAKYRTTDKLQPNTETTTTTTTLPTTTTPSTTTITPSTTTTTTTTTSTTTTTTSTTTTTTTTTPSPTTPSPTSTITPLPSTTSTTTTTTTTEASTTRPTPAGTLLIVPKGAAQSDHVLQNSSTTRGKEMAANGTMRSGMVAFVVLALAVLTMALAIGGRKAMESFDRRHYTRLELNDLHYEV